MSLNGKDIKAPLVYENMENIKIEKCKFYGMDGKVAITLKNCKGVEIIDCEFSGCGGIYAVKSNDISVKRCYAMDIMAAFPRGQFFQGNECSGPIMITDNRIICDNDKRNDTEDIINFFKCVGSEKNPIVVSVNYISNLGASSKTGGGIMLGNGAPSSWQFAFDNVLVNPGQYGIAISGGSHFKIAGNQVYSQKTLISNVGMYVWSQNPRGETGTPPVISDVEIQYNKVNWTSKTGTKNSWWQGSPVTNLKMQNNDFKWLQKPSFPIKEDEKKEPEEADPVVKFERDGNGKIKSITILFQ